MSREAPQCCSIKDIPPNGHDRCPSRKVKGWDNWRYSDVRDTLTRAASIFATATATSVQARLTPTTLAAKPRRLLMRPLPLSGLGRGIFGCLDG